MIHIVMLIVYILGHLKLQNCLFYDNTGVMTVLMINDKIYYMMVSSRLTTFAENIMVHQSFGLSK